MITTFGPVVLVNMKSPIFGPRDTAVCLSFVTLSAFWLNSIITNAVKSSTMFVQEGDYVVLKKESNMKVLQVTVNRYVLPYLFRHRIKYKVPVTV